MGFRISVFPGDSRPQFRGGKDGVQKWVWDPRESAVEKSKGGDAKARSGQAGDDGWGKAGTPLRGSPFQHTAMGILGVESILDFRNPTFNHLTRLCN